SGSRKGKKVFCFFIEVVDVFARRLSHRALTSAPFVAQLFQPSRGRAPHISTCRCSLRTNERGGFMMRRFLSSMFVGVCVVTLNPTLARGDIVSTFDTGDEGWRVVSFQNLTTDDFSIKATYTPTFNASGGNPGGFISTTD